MAAKKTMLSITATKDRWDYKINKNISGLDLVTLLGWLMIVFNSVEEWIDEGLEREVKKKNARKG